MRVLPMFRDCFVWRLQSKYRRVDIMNQAQKKTLLLKLAILPGFNKQNGFTLTELIISTGLGILLSATLTQVYLSSAQTDTLIQQQSLMQENARFAFSFIGESVRHAGFAGSLPEQQSALSNTSIAFNNLGVIFSQADHSVVGFDNSEAGDAPAGARENSDQLFIRYQGVQAGLGEDAPITDCLGVALEEKEVVQIRYYLDADNAQRSLLCASFIEGRDKAYQAQPLIDQVNDLQFLYGLDTDNDGVINIYLPASDERLNGGGNNWNQVVAVKMNIGFESNNEKTVKAFTEIIGLRNR